MPKSEIARLQQRSQEQAQAAWMGLYGLTEVGRHQVITSKMERMGETLQALAQKAGRREEKR